MTYEERRKTIESLLDHWEDYFSPGGSLDGGTGDGAGPVLSSMASSRQVKELLRCMGLCQRMAPGHYKHLIGYYSSPFRLVDMPIKRKDAKGRWVDDIERGRERIVPSWLSRLPACREPRCPCGGVLPRMVCRAEDFLISVWSFPREDCPACKDRDPGTAPCERHVLLELPKALREASRAKLREFVDPVTGEHGWTMAA